MKYEKSLFLSVFVILLSGITACNELEDVSRTVTGVTVKLPDDLSGASIANDTLTFQNISSGLSVKVPATEKPELPQGLYNCFYKADVTYVDERALAWRFGKCESYIRECVINDEYPSAD